MFAKIVVGFDGSETAERALRLACDLAKKYSSNLYVVHTPQPQTVAFAMGAVAGYHVATTMPHHDEVQKASDKVKEQANAIAVDCGVAITDIHVEMGEPGDAIVEYAEKCGADLIVTGRRGLGALGALVQGSTSLRVNHRATCASLSVI